MPNQPAGCLFGFLANLFGGRPAKSSTAPKVIINKFFITDAERNFFHVLRQVVGPRAHILAQVSLRQLLFFPNAPGRQSWQNRANRAIDFVLCDPGTLRPLVAIELDDKTHTRPDRQTRDDNVETLLTAAGLPLLHILASRTYSVNELQSTLAPYLPDPSKTKT